MDSEENLSALGREDVPSFVQPEGQVFVAELPRMQRLDIHLPFRLLSKRPCHQ